jgi:hypothetical protein
MFGNFDVTYCYIKTYGDVKIMEHGYILDAGKGFLIIFMRDKLPYGLD